MVSREGLIILTPLFYSMEWIQLEISSLLSNCGRSTINHGTKYPLTRQLMMMEEKLRLLIYETICNAHVGFWGPLRLKILLWRKLNDLKALPVQWWLPFSMVIHIIFCCKKNHFVCLSVLKVLCLHHMYVHIVIEQNVTSYFYPEIEEVCVHNWAYFTLYNARLSGHILPSYTTELFPRHVGC